MPEGGKMENISINTENIREAVASLGAAAVLLFILPLVFLAVWKKCGGKSASLRSAFIGAAGFMLFARVLELGVHMVCIIADNPISRFINGNTLAYVIYGISAAGIFEECGRYIMIKLFMKKNRTKENYIMYGIGHGGIEVWAVILAALISYIIIAVTLKNSGVSGALELMGVAADAGEKELSAAYGTISAAVSFNLITAALYVIERIGTMLIHISLTVIVAYGIETGEKKYLGAAILLHAAIDIFAALSQRGAVSMVLLEVWLIAWTCALVFIGRRLYLKLGTAADEKL